MKETWPRPPGKSLTYPGMVSVRRVFHPARYNDSDSEQAFVEGDRTEWVSVSDLMLVGGALAYTERLAGATELLRVVIQWGVACDHAAKVSPSVARDGEWLDNPTCAISSAVTAAVPARLPTRAEALPERLPGMGLERPGDRLETLALGKAIEASLATDGFSVPPGDLSRAVAASLDSHSAAVEAAAAELPSGTVRREASQLEAAGVRCGEAVEDAEPWERCSSAGCPCDV